MGRPANTLVIACGALAHEITSIVETYGLTHMTIQCLPAKLHNTPAKIPEQVRQKIHSARNRFDHILVAYGDCGTGGMLDAVLEEEKVERIAGPHCYQFYAGTDNFLDLSEADPATFYLTDFLVRHFDRLVMQGLGIDRHPQLLESYFGNYNRLLYLAQTENAELVSMARQAADKLGLTYQYCFTGMGELSDFLTNSDQGNQRDGDTDHTLLA